MTERLKGDARAMAMCAAPASRQFCRPKGSRFGRTAEGGKKEGGGPLGACTLQPPSAARRVGTTSPGIFARWRRILCLAAFRAAEHTVNRSDMFRINSPNVADSGQGARQFEASSIGTRCAVCTENHAAPLSSRSGAQPLQGLRRQRPLRARAAALLLQGVRWRRPLRAWAAAQPMQGLRRCQHLRARAAALQVQGVLRQP